MPAAVQRPCLRPGCGSLVDAGWCSEHRKPSRTDKARPVPSQRGYDAIWYRLRALVLSIHPICQSGEKCANLPIHLRVATQVDHIIPIRQRPDLRLVAANLQALCSSCHSAKTWRETHGEHIT